MHQYLLLLILIVLLFQWNFSVLQYEVVFDSSYLIFLIYYLDIQLITIYIDKDTPLPNDVTPHSKPHNPQALDAQQKQHAQEHTQWRQ